MAKFFSCPNCGADVPMKALACPECGSDKDTGWSEAAQYVHLLPDRGEDGWADVRKTPWRKLAIATVAVLIITGFLASQGLGWIIVLLPAAIALGIGVRSILQQGFSISRWGMERKLYRQLLHRTQGDQALAERLIASERRRTPHANRLQVLQNAIFYSDRDRR